MFRKDPFQFRRILPQKVFPKRLVRRISAKNRGILGTNQFRRFPGIFVASIHFQKSFENFPESPIVLPKLRKDDLQSAQLTDFAVRSIFALEFFEILDSSSSFSFSESPC